MTALRTVVGVAGGAMLLGAFCIFAAPLGVMLPGGIGLEVWYGLIVVGALTLGAGAFLGARPQGLLRWSLGAALVWMLLWLLHPAAGSSYSFFGLLPVKIFAVAATAGTAVTFFRSTRAPLLMLGVWQLLAVLALLEYADGRMLFSDDHPSFAYRLHLLKENFPAIPFYNPDWNAGYQAREFFPSGVLNVFLLAAPLIYAIDFTAVSGIANYNLVILFVFIGLVPWFTYAAVRIAGGEKFGAALAGSVAIFPSVIWADWLLRYGTLGFCLSAAVFPLALVLLWRSLCEQRLVSWPVCVLTILITSLCILWSLAAFALLPVGLCVGWSIVRGRSFRKLLTCLILVAVNLPWMLVFVRESKVLSFVQGSSRPASVFTAAAATVDSADAHEAEAVTPKWEERWKATKAHIIHAAERLNPVVALVGSIGLIAAVAGGGVGKVLIATLLWLGLISFSGGWLKPQLELHRFSIFASYLLIVGIGLAVTRLQALKSSSLWRQRATTVALMLIAVQCYASSVAGVFVLSGRSREYIPLAPRYLGELVAAIAEHGGDGRVFIPGFILHDLGARAYDTQDGGHVALLPVLSGKPFYAFNFYHTSWTTVDPIPSKYRQRAHVGVNEFFDILNVTAVVTFKREWARFFIERKRSNYEEVFKSDRFRVFRRKSPASGYVLQGSAQVFAERNGVSVIPETQEVTLKFRYHERLRTAPAEGVRLEAVEVFADDLPGGKQAPVHFVRLAIAPHLVGKRIKLSM